MKTRIMSALLLSTVMFSCKELINPGCGNATFTVLNRSTQIIDHVVINGGIPTGCYNLLPNDQCSSTVPSKESFAYSAVGKKGGTWGNNMTLEDCAKLTLTLTD